MTVTPNLCSAIIERGCLIEDGVHISLGAIVKGENRMATTQKIEAGYVIQFRSNTL